MTEKEIKEALRVWILKNGRIEAKELTDETMIFENRVITSLQGLDFVLYMESLIGKTIDIEKLTLHDFRNIDAIYAGVLQKLL